MSKNKVTTGEQAIDGFLLSCKVKGKCYGADVLYFSDIPPCSRRKGAMLSQRHTEASEMTKGFRRPGLEEGGDMYRFISENSGDIVCFHDLDHRYVYVNPACKEILGYDPEELIGANPWELVHPQDLETLQEVGRRKAAKGEPVLLTYRIRKKSGEYVWFETVSRLLKDNKGGTLGFVTSSRDISERKQTELEFKDIIQKSIEGFWVADMQGRFLEVNDAYCQLVGYRRDELLKMSISDIEVVEKHTETVARIARIKKVGGDQFVTRHRCKNGKIVDVEISANYCNLGADRIYVFIRDITERKKAEEVIRESEAKYRFLTENMTDIVFTIDLNMKTTYVTPSVEKILGFTPEERMRQHPQEQFTPASYKLAAETLQQELERERSSGIVADKLFTLELDYYHKNGSVITTEVTAHAIRDKQGKPSGIYGLCRDITEQKKSLEQLRESEEKYRTLFENSYDAILLTIPDGRIVAANPAACRLFGRSEQEICRVGRDGLVNLGDPRLEVALRERARLGMYGSEITFIRKDGTRIIGEVTSSQFVDNAGQPRTSMIIRDITERRKLQEHLMITDRLASIGELASGMAHELNNPLTGVIGFSELLMNADLPEKAREYARLIYREARRTAEVVKNLLTFARKHPPVKQLVNINDIIGKVLELRAYEQRVNNIQVVTHLDTDLPEIVADDFQLQQVFLNIVINAEYFMVKAHGDGTLTVTTERHGEMIQVSFADDGPGINPQTIGHIFDPFYTTKPIGKGTGLGLSICHGIVAEHGGRIYAESEPDNGATFIIELPLSEQSEI